MAEKRLRKREGRAKSTSAQTGANPAETINVTHLCPVSFCSCFHSLCLSPSLCQLQGGKGETGLIPTHFDALELPRTIPEPHAGENMSEGMQCAVPTAILFIPLSAQTLPAIDVHAMSLHDPAGKIP